MPRRDQQALEGIEIVVGEAAPRGPRKNPSHNRAIVDGGIADQEILWSHQLSDHAKIGGIAAHNRHAIIDAVVCGERGLKRAVNGPLARYMPAARWRDTIMIDRFLCGRSDPRVSIEAQIVIRGKIDNLAPVNPRARSRAGLMHSEVRRPDPNLLADRALYPQLFESLKGIEIDAALVGGRLRERGRRRPCASIVAEQGNSGQ